MEGKVKDTQNERILDYMRAHGSINPMQALGELGVMRLASRISELRTERHAPIVRDLKSALNRYGEPVRYAEYTLTDPDFDKKSA